MEIGNWVRGARLLICQEDVGGSEKFFARMKRRRVMMGINVIIVSRGAAFEEWREMNVQICCSFFVCLPYSVL